MSNNFRGHVSIVPMPTNNSSEEFSNQVRVHGADGTIAQAHGGSKATAWMGDSHYETERMCAGRANGTFRPEVVGKGKKISFARGHNFEKAVAETCVDIMRFEAPGIEIQLLDASKEEWRNSDWPSAAAHLDFFIKVTKGKAVMNPNFVIGGPARNYLIVPDPKDHIYIADSKTVGTYFGAAWAELDEIKRPVGGLKHGIAPTAYRQQMLYYMAVCHIEGAFLLGSVGYGDKDFAMVYVPFEPEEAHAMMDEIERLNNDSLHGIIPSVRDCKDVLKAIQELPMQYPDVNKNKKMLKLSTEKWKDSMDQLDAIDKRIAEVNTLLKPYKEEIKKKIEDELGLELTGSLSWDTVETKKLKEDRAGILMMPLEEVMDGPGCYYEDPDTHDVVSISYSSNIKWDTKSKAALAEDYPEVFEDLRLRFPDRKPKLERTHAKKAK